MASFIIEECPRCLTADVAPGLAYCGACGVRFGVCCETVGAHNGYHRCADAAQPDRVVYSLTEPEAIVVEMALRIAANVVDGLGLKGVSGSDERAFARRIEASRKGATDE